MRTLYLVRHGHAEAKFDAAHDPGLDDVGRAQADTAAAELAPLGPLPLVTSPMRRTRETAAPFEHRWAVPARVEPGVGEVETPSDDLAERGTWVSQILRRGRQWSELDAERHRWRADVVRALLSIGEDTVVFTHFLAINVAVGVAKSSDEILQFWPDNCSCTVLESDGSSLRVVELGRQAETAVR